jgi:hypothetical protein
MHNTGFSSFTGMIATYVAACIAMIGAYGSHIVQFLGFILLVSRLVVEVPRAYVAIREWVTKKKDEMDGRV